uniref:Brevican n=1 Tax=Pundamilia nyererei TaxID=303518 RepID=A0A3B4FS54_9CICH
QLYWISGISKALISAKAPPSLAVNDGDFVAPLSSSISIPCVVSLSPISNSTSATPVVPRVKWSVISRGVETQILVVRGHKVKVNEAYRDRAALLNYTSFPDDASLWLGDLRSSDSAHYRCEVQQGLEDASDLVELKVKGVVFHYRDALGRYAFTFHQAQRACEAIGARIATADQLLASYYDGYEQCDAGWLADQSVRYPIQVPREACYGDMDGQPGVRNYGTMDPDDLFDVYCYVDEINGEVFHDFIPQQLTFNEAQSYCRAAGAELATTAQLYLAWSEGLDHCSPGWLSDGSVRYPIITPRERCGGALPGVKTLYQFSNQTGFPEPSSLHDVYCFKEPEDIEHNVVILTEKYQEIQLNQLAEQVEREAQSMLESLPYFTVSVTTESPVDTHPMLISDTTESPLHTTPTLHEPLDQTLSPTEMSYDSQHPTALMSSTITETHNSAENTSFLPTDYNETYSSQNSSLTFQQSERPTFEPEMQNQTEPDTNIEVNTEPSGTLNETKEVQQTTLSFNKSEPNYSETDSNRSKEDSLLEATTLTLNPMVEVELEETRVDPEQMFPPTEASKEEEEEATLLTQLSQTTESTPEVLTSVWAPLDGSGDISEDACLLNPCLNGGTCTDRGGHIKCLCLPTYEGNFCQAGELRCEPGWDKFHGFCYRHFSQRLSWEAAEQHCRMMGAHLVSIITPEEQAYINNNYKEYQWTGLNDKTIENDFHWSDGNPLLYENWYRGQPDSYFLSGEDCVVMVWHDNGRWSDVPCNYHLSYTCKKGTSSCGPPPRVRNASIYGKARQTYETNAVVRYRCAEGFQQRFNPLIRCLSGGFWERPQILCLTGEIREKSRKDMKHTFNIQSSFNS